MCNMETRLLKMFCAVAETGSIASAAGKLHLTPSALSHGLKALETELGARLFDRTGKKLLLNQAGEQFLAQVRPLLDGIDAAAASIKQLGKWGQARLRVAATASACQHILPSVIRELKKIHPKLDLQVESGDMPLMIDLIHANKVDLALGLAPEQRTGLVVTPVFNDELMFVFAPGHSWADGRPISRDDLRTQPLILYQRSSLTAHLVNDFFRKLDLVPSTVMEIGSMQAIKELVKLNLGVSVLAPWTAEKELELGSLKMRPVGAHPIRRHWAVVSLASRRRSLPEETFVRLCRSHATGMRLDRRDLGAAMRSA